MYAKNKIHGESQDTKKLALTRICGTGCFRQTGHNMTYFSSLPPVFQGDRGDAEVRAWQGKRIQFFVLVQVWQRSRIKHSLSAAERPYRRREKAGARSARRHELPVCSAREIKSTKNAKRSYHNDTHTQHCAEASTPPVLAQTLSLKGRWVLDFVRFANRGTAVPKDSRPRTSKT